MSKTTNPRIGTIETVYADGETITGKVYNVRDNGWACVETDRGRCASGPAPSDELSEREYECMLDTFRTASEWHGGQFSALYSYSSTGEIHGTEHQDSLLTEIDGCLSEAESQLDAGHLTELDLSALEHLRYTVECWPNEAI